MSHLLYDAHQYQVFRPIPMQLFMMRAGAWLWLGVLILVGVVVIGGTLQQPAVVTLLFTGLWLYILIRSTLFSIYQMLAADRMRIIISDEVIEFHTFGYSKICGWYNVAGIEKVRRGKQTAECLVLNRSTEIGSLWWLWIAEGLPMRRAIPLSDFSPNWRTTPLGKAIRQHAPHLFVSN